MQRTNLETKFQQQEETKVIICSVEDKTRKNKTLARTVGQHGEERDKQRVNQNGSYPRPMLFLLTQALESKQPILHRKKIHV